MQNSPKIISPNFDRVMPHDSDIEESIISACFFDNAQEVVDLISPDIFYNDSNSKVISAICDIVKQGLGCELLTVKKRLEELKQLEEIGGASRLAQFINDIPMAVNIEHYCKKLYQLSALRKLAYKSSEYFMRAFDLTEDPESLIDEAQKDINQIAVKDKDCGQRLNKIVEHVADLIDERIANKQKITGVNTGFDGLNWYTNGFQSTDLIIIAARPGMGKTAFALNLLANASKSGAWVDFYSYEMGKEQLAMRLIAMAGKINFRNLRSGYLTKEELSRYTSAASSVHEYKATIDDATDLTIGALRRRARKIKKTHNTGLIIIDYLQLIPKPKANSTNDAVGEISRNLKMMAKELQVPVIALAQLNRKVEDRSSKIPSLADLRDSGNIEQDADIVLFPYRPAAYLKKMADDGVKENPEYIQKKNDAEIHIAKHRNGPVGMIRIKWDEEYSSFSNQTESQGY